MTAGGVTTSMPLLDVRGLVAGYDGVPVVRQLDLTVGKGEVVALLGPNGAGKTTTLQTVAALLPIIDGEITAIGMRVESTSTHQLARRGLALLPQNRGIFFQLTVAEHLRLRTRRRSSVGVADVLEYFPALKPLLGRRAGLLSGGEQQMLALSCQLLSEPTLLMVDEISLGLAPIVVERLLPVLGQICADTGAGVLLVEQQVNAALEVSHRAYVLAHGEVVLTGDSESLLRDRDVLEAAYLGERVL